MLVALLVTSTTGASPITVAVSVMPPTLRAKSTGEVLPRETEMFSRLSGRKPVTCARTSKVPGSRPANR